MSLAGPIFETKIAKCVESVKRILHSTRSPVSPAQVPHSYANKYDLANHVTCSALAATLNVLEEIGLDEAKLKQILKWGRHKQVTLRFEAQQYCVFLAERTQKIESPEIQTTTSKTLSSTTQSQKVVVTVVHYVYKVESSWELFAFEGSDPKSKIVLLTKSGTVEFKTEVKDSPPFPASSIRPPIDCDISFLLQNISDNLQVSFSIDRNDPNCHTPRRNQDIDKSHKFVIRIQRWCNNIVSFFKLSLLGKIQNDEFDQSMLEGESIFVPVVPLFEKRSVNHPRIENAAGKDTEISLVRIDGRFDETSVLLSLQDVNAFLSEQKRSMSEKFDSVTRAFPADETGGLFTVLDAKLMISLLHMDCVSQKQIDSVDFIEEMLRQQLITAIGKDVNSEDFSEYLKSHYRKLFSPSHQPKPFSFAVRQAGHFPEGSISIENSLKGTLEPIFSLCKGLGAGELTFAINAATNVSVIASRFIHASVFHSFQRVESSNGTALIARARQFSSFVLILGNVVSDTVFNPSHAVILQNKDELTVPLVLKMLSTGKEFKDSISSLSPEMQTFAKAYREMQLEGTLFGILVIHIKPQLEKLLNLPHGSLTKEIRLNQDLMEMFLRYQIPSDLMTFDGPSDYSGTQKVAQVSEHVEKLKSMIADAKQASVEEAKAKATEGFYSNTHVESRELPGSPSYSSTPVFVPLKAMSSSPGAMRSLPPPAPHVSSARTLASAMTPALMQTQGPTETRHRVIPIVTDTEINLTGLPKRLEDVFEKYHLDQMHPTTITLSETWTKISQATLLASRDANIFNGKHQSDEKKRAFDLLDALSRSGSLEIEHAELHVIVAVTHVFEDTLIDTVIQKNVDPIAAFEKGLVAVGEALFEVDGKELVNGSVKERLGFL